MCVRERERSECKIYYNFDDFVLIPGREDSEDSPAADEDDTAEPQYCNPETR